MAAEAIVAFTFAGAIAIAFLWFNGIIPDTTVVAFLGKLGDRLMAIAIAMGIF